MPDQSPCNRHSQLRNAFAAVAERCRASMRFLFLTLLIVVSPAQGRDYSDMVEGKDISWDLTPDSLMVDFQPGKTVAWFGVLKEKVVFKNDQGVTMALFLFENHRMINSHPASLNEPLRVDKSGAGFFVVYIEFETLEPDEVRAKMLDKLKHPQHAIVVGRPAQLGKFGSGVPSVLMHTDKMNLSDEMVVLFEASE